MIRYIYIGAQIIEGGKQFAFYDTVKDRFVELAGVQVFDSISDFKNYMRINKNNREIFERCLKLIPNSKYHPIFV